VLRERAPSEMGGITRRDLEERGSGGTVRKSVTWAKEKDQFASGYKGGIALHQGTKLQKGVGRLGRPRNADPGSVRGGEGREPSEKS